MLCAIDREAAEIVLLGEVPSPVVHCQRLTIAVRKVKGVLLVGVRRIVDVV